MESPPENTPPPTPRSRKRLALYRTAAVLGTLGVTFLVLELGARGLKGEYRLTNFWAETLDLFHRALPVEFHPELGWIPEKGSTRSENIWKTQVTILDHGIRANDSGATEVPSRVDILAVGDSFTFGDEVSDPDTWPARLEKSLGRPVVNGGVFGYGVDQTYLRMLQLAEIVRPRVVVLSLIAPDIGRCELRERTSVTKPYYGFDGDELVLHDDHVVPPAGRDERSGLPRVLGYSYLIHKLMLRSFPSYWLQGASRDVRVHDRGEDVTCEIFRRLGGFVEMHPTVEKVVILIQYGADPPSHRLDQLDRVLACVESPLVEVLDLRHHLDPLRRSDPEGHARLFQRHMTAEGNAFVARILEQHLRGQ